MKVPYQRPQLKKGAIPIIFPNCPKYLTKKKVMPRKILNRRCQENLCENRRERVNEDDLNSIVTESQQNSITLNSEFNNLFENKKLSGLNDSWAIFPCAEEGDSKTILFSQNSVKNQIPVFYKQVILNENFELKYFFGNKHLKIDGLVNAVSSIQETIDAINYFSKISLCLGGPISSSFQSVINTTECAYIDHTSKNWRHNKCTFLNAEYDSQSQCKFCKSLYKTFNRIIAKTNTIKKRRRTTAFGLKASQHILKKSAVEKYLLSKKVKKLKSTVEILKKNCEEVKKKYIKLSEEDFENKLDKLGFPHQQKLLINECINLSHFKTKTSRRYTSEWIT